MKVAIVCDWLVGGGAEKVVLELHKMFPEAPIYTSYCVREWREKLDNKVITGFLGHWPFSNLRKFLPILRIWWFEHLDLSDFDLVISSSGAEAKGIKTKTPTLHVNYCHAPTHYYWSRYDEYMSRPGFGLLDPLARVGLKLLVGPLRAWDKKAAGRADYMIANSSNIQAQIQKYYGRDSAVIFPPVDVKSFKNGQNKRSGFIVSGRQTPYKKIDLAVAACTKLNLPLTVVGDGPDHQKLINMAGPSIKFLGFVPDKEVANQLSKAEAFIFPALDDFGIAPVEAMAAGTPVIAYKAGGALDYVEPGITGEFFDEQTVESLTEALKNFKPERYDPDATRTKAERFSTENFQKSFRTFLNNKVQ